MQLPSELNPPPPRDLTAVSQVTTDNSQLFCLSQHLTEAVAQLQLSMLKDKEGLSAGGVARKVI